MKGLSDSDAKMWNRITRDVTPLDCPESPASTLPAIRVNSPHATPFSPRVDLHGITVHEAFNVVQEHIYQGSINGYKKLMVITGRSGQINQELPRWLERNTKVRSVKQMPNGGSWEITIKPAT